MKESIPIEVLDKVCTKIGNLPRKERGIKIHKDLVKATLEILNEAEGNVLPQNCRNDIVERTKDGLDRRIKIYLDSDIRTANIISDVLADVGIVDIVKVPNLVTGINVKATRLKEEWTW